MQRRLCALTDRLKRASARVAAILQQSGRHHAEGTMANAVKQDIAKMAALQTCKRQENDVKPAGPLATPAARQFHRS
jgi:hypothetical protein